MAHVDHGAAGGAGLYRCMWLLYLGPVPRLPLPNLAERFWPQAFVDARHTSPVAARSKIRSQLREFGIMPSPQLEQHLFLWR